MPGELRPQPGGFEGFITCRVLASAQYPAVSNDAGDVVTEAGRHAAPPAASRNANDDDDLFPDLRDDLHHLDLQLIDRVDPVLVVPPEGALASHEADVIQGALDRSPLDIRVPEPRDGLQSTAPKRSKLSANDSHVLLRHRPPSIPPGKGRVASQSPRSRRPPGGSA